MKNFSLIFLSLSMFLFDGAQKYWGATPNGKPIPLLVENALNTRELDSLEINSYNSAVLSSFYYLNAYKKAWLKEAPRKEILLALDKSHEEGLNPEDYAVTRLKNFEDNFDALSTAEKNTYDILFTHHLQKYLAHLSNGKLNPNKLYSNWEIKENEIDLNATLMDLKKGEFVTEKIECLKPDHIVYKKLKKALKLVEALADESFENIHITDPINPNTTDPLLLEIKKRLLYWGDLKKKEKPTPLYDPETVKAVQCFQKRHGLAPDGIIGKETVATLNFSKQERKEQIIANLERWKWYPKNMGNEYVIINIPDYQLHLIKGKDTLRSHKIIVGRPKRPTPVLSSKLTQVIFNPTWTVPPTILREDLIPEVRKNRQYLAKLNIIIYDKNGNRVPLQNWTASNAAEYKYVQKPSVNNSLGVVKLDFPNRFSVYLHDTNHRDFFEKTNRSLSSGCVRLENPLALTRYLLNDSLKWNSTKIDEVLKTSRTTYVKINKEVYFHLLYWTAWSTKNKLVFRADIYHLDKALYALLRN